MTRLTAIALLAALLSSAAIAGADVPAYKDAYDTLEATCTGDQFDAWTDQTVDGQKVKVSPVIDSPDSELNHYHVTVVYKGSGTVKAAVAYNGTNDLNRALTTSYLHRPLRAVKSGEEVVFFNPYAGHRYVWVILQGEGEVKVEGVRLRAAKVKGGLHGHVGAVYEYAGGKLPYRLMYPRDYDPKKKYPLVVNVPSSGGVGTDNRRNMELVGLSKYLYTQYWLDDDLACFSIVTQIPTKENTPKGWWPNGDRGGPTPLYHPDWASVNEDSWYTQATLALTRDLIKDPKLSIDPDRIYFAGFSFGGKAIWEFLKADRTLFAGAIGVGGWPIGRAYSKPEGALLDRLKMEVDRYKHVPMIIAAGEKDAMRYGSKAAVDLIEAAKGSAKYVEHAGANHVSSAGRTWGNIETIRWLFQQNRQKNPRPGPDPYPGGKYPEAAADPR